MTDNSPQNSPPEWRASYIDPSTSRWLVGPKFEQMSDLELEEKLAITNKELSENHSTADKVFRFGYRAGPLLASVFGVLALSTVVPVAVVVPAMFVATAVAGSMSGYMDKKADEAEEIGENLKLDVDVITDMLANRRNRLNGGAGVKPGTSPTPA